MIRTLFLLVLSLSLAGPVAGAGASTLTEDDKDDIARIETYLNGITTLRSRFIQRSSSGNVASGQVYLSRPGRMRFEYDPPAPILLVADGLFLIYIDKELQQISNVPISSTPLRVLIDEDVNLTASHDVAGLDRGSGTLSVMLTMKDDPEAGAVRLLFTDRPLALKQWFIRDAQGIEVRVTLLDAVRGMELDSDLFKVDPNMFGDRDNQP